jgi:hypothetical protein
VGLGNLHPKRVYRVCACDEIARKEGKHHQNKGEKSVTVIAFSAPFDIGEKALGRHLLSSLTLLQVNRKQRTTLLFFSRKEKKAKEKPHSALRRNELLSSFVSYAQIPHSREVFEVGVGEKLFSPSFLFGKRKEGKRKAP